MYAWATLGIFTLLTLIDFSRIRAGGDGFTAVDLAVSIYLDGLNIFIALLQLFGMRSRERLTPPGLEGMAQPMMCGDRGPSTRQGLRRRAPRCTSACMLCSIAARRAPASRSATARRLACHREMGLLTGVFNEEILGRLPATWRSATRATRRPVPRSSSTRSRFSNAPTSATFAFAHNGNLTNADALLETLSPTTVDLDGHAPIREVMAKTDRARNGPMLSIASRRRCAVAEGAYSIVMMHAGFDSTRFAIRGACGRCAWARYGDGGYMVASESCALATVGAQYLREIERGEIVRHRSERLAQSVQTPRSKVPPALCMFEYIYFARPDSALERRSIYMARYQMGRAAGARISRRRRRRDGGAGFGDSRRRSVTRPRAACRTSKG